MKKRENEGLGCLHRLAMILAACLLGAVGTRCANSAELNTHLEEDSAPPMLTCSDSCGAGPSTANPLHIEVNCQAASDACDGCTSLRWVNRRILDLITFSPVTEAPPA